MKDSRRLDRRVRQDLSDFRDWLSAHASPQGVKWRIADRVIRTNYSYCEVRITYWFDDEGVSLTFVMRGRDGDLDMAIALATPL